MFRFNYAEGQIFQCLASMDSRIFALFLLNEVTRRFKVAGSWGLWYYQWYYPYCGLL